MQIGSGQAPLSLAMLKALGAQFTALQPTAAAAKGVVAKSADSPAAAAKAPGVDTGDGLTTARNLPRGSFVDLRA